MEIKDNKTYLKRLGINIEKDLENFEYNDTQIYSEHKFDNLVPHDVRNLSAEKIAEVKEENEKASWDVTKPYIGWSQPNPDLTGKNNI